MTDLPDLDRLIAAVIAEAVGEEPLDRLAAAARVRDDLDQLTEALLDHFVEEARQAGCSWSQIGAALGVSKQAAQQRHTAVESVARQLLARLPQLRKPGGRGPFFARFTAGARRSVVLAQGAARRLQHNYIGTEHLLLGVLEEQESAGARALAELGVTGEEVEAAVVEEIGLGTEPGGGHIPFTPRAKKVLELALREAIKMGHKHIGTEHVVLAITREGKGVAAQILAARGADDARVREVVQRLLDDAA
ncbi:MAG TPA: Clp protease N-terminal domain-containing protein [Acidimicrobiia bacterium]